MEFPRKNLLNMHFHEWLYGKQPVITIEHIKRVELHDCKQLYKKNAINP